MANDNVAQFTGTLKTETYPNKYNAVIPPEGPFYRTGLKITALDGTPLIEGLDYYLGYYFKEAAVALKDQIYGGIMLLTQTAVNYTINSAGRQYRIPISEIGKFLVSQDIKDPRNVDWSELMVYPPVVAPIDPPANIDEALLRDEVVKALDDIRQGLLSRAAEMDVAFSEVTDAIFANGEKIFQDNLYQHHKIKNAHQYTAEEIGALKVLAKAVDSTKAFGRTLEQLVDLMKTTGIQQAHIDTLMPVVLGELRGRLRVLDNGALVFRTADSSHSITLQGEKFLITTTRPINITADADNNEAGIAVEVGAGLNTMYVASGAKAPIFNGAYLVTPDMVSLYLSSIKLLPANAHFQSTDQVTVFGSGKESAPVKMTTSVPGANLTTPGLIMVTSISSDLSPSAAISQNAVNALKLTLDKYVDSTYTVNGKKFVSANGKQSLDLTADDVGVGKMDNTSPTQKPLTKAMTAALLIRAKSDHTHVFSDLINVPTASSTVAGLMQLWDAIDTTTNKLVTSKQGYNVQQRINRYQSAVDSLLPTWTTSGASYGNAGFLPIPTVSNYAGFGYFRANSLGMIGVTANVAYVLRNGTDGPEDTNRVYYWYSPIDANGRLSAATPTTYLYNPPGMNKFPGVGLKQILVAGDGLALFLGTDNNLYLITMSGTMDPAQHNTVVRVTVPNLKLDNGSEFAFMSNYPLCNIVSTTKRFVLVATQLSNSGFRMGAWYLDISAAVAGSTQAMSVMKIDGPYKYGDMSSLVAEGGPVNDDTTTKTIAYSTQAGRDLWAGRALVNYRASMFAASKGDSIRVRGEAHGYYSNSKTAQWSAPWSAIYALDASNGKLVLESNIFPLAMTENRTEFPNGKPLSTLSTQTQGTAFFSNMFSTGGFLIQIYCDVYSNNAPNVTITPHPDKPYYDVLGSDESLRPTNTLGLAGAAGSVYRQYMRAAIHLGGADQKIAFRRLSTQDAIVSKYTLDGNYFPEYPGYGPDNDRVALAGATWSALAMTPAVWKGGTLYLNGRVVNEAGTFAYKTIPGTTNFTADRITVSQAQLDSLGTAMQNATPRYSSDLLADSQFSVQLYDIGGQNVALGILSVREWESADQARAWLYNSVWKVPMTVDSSGNVSFSPASMLQVVKDLREAIAATSLLRDQHIQPKLYQRDDGWVICAASVVRYGVVGDSRWASYVLTCDTNWANWTNAEFLVNPGTGESDLFLMPETGYIGYTKWLYNGMYYAVGLKQNKSRTFNVGTTYDNVIAGVKTASGWILYITEEEELRFGSDYYTLPAYQADIRDLFPSTYANNTFYMYVTRVNGIASYLLSAIVLSETANRIYIGAVKTDSARITSSVFNKVKRTGALKQLEEHAGVKYRHDVDASRERALSPLGLLGTMVQGVGVSDYPSMPVLGSTLNVNTKPTVKGRTLDFTRGQLEALLSADSNFAIPCTATPIAASQNQQGQAAGAYWLTHPEITTDNVLYRIPVPFTPATAKLAVDIYLPTSSKVGAVNRTILVNGKSVTIPLGSTARVELTVVAKAAMTVEISGVFGPERADVAGPIGFTVLDWDATAGAYKAIVSSSPSTLFMVKPQPGDNSLPNSVWKAVEIPLADLGDVQYPIVSFSGLNVRTPIIYKTNSIVVVLSFRAGTTQVEVDNLRVNLMKLIN